MALRTRVIGPISAYAIAVSKGYTGTEEEFAQEIANASTNAATAQAAADHCDDVLASIPQDYSALSNSVNGLKISDDQIFNEQQLIYNTQLNLFNRLDTRIVSGKYIQNDGTYGTYSDAYISHPILIGPGTYKFNCAPGTFGVHAGAVGVYNAAGNITGVINSTVSSSVATFTVDSLTLVCFNLNGYLLKTAVFCAEALWDGTYHPYQTAVRHDLLDLTGSVKKEDTDFFTLTRSANLLDKTQAIDGKYFNVAATAGIGNLNSSSSNKSFYVLLDGAGSYATKVDTSLYGSDNAKKICLFDKNKNFIQLVVGTLGTSSDNRGVPLVFAVTSAHIANGAVYAGITINNYYLNTVMMVKSDAYPSVYTPYSEKWTIPDQTVEASQIPTVNRSSVDLTDSVEKEDTTFFAEEKSINLLDLSDPYENTYFNPASQTSSYGQLVTDSSNTLTSFYVALDGAGTYMTRVNRGYFGDNAAKLCIYDSAKNFLGAIVGTLGTGASNSSVPITFEVTQSHVDSGIKYIGLSVSKTYLNTTMVVKSDTYPGLYMAYYDRWTIPDLFSVGFNNPLYGKTAIFDGDSICDPNNYGSYAKIICENNYMPYHNAAVSGGTITSGLYYDGGGARHWVSTNVDALYAAYPDADYIIFEGGTNDADLIGNATGSTMPAKFGTYTETDYSGSYDDETFCGAVETLFYKAVNYWPKKKIGFVIAMKMGIAGQTYYHNRYKYFETIMDICKKWGIPYINLWDGCPMNSNLEVYWDPSMTAAENRSAGKCYNDGQHPTPAGYQVIAPMIEAWMKTL